MAGQSNHYQTLADQDVNRDREYFEMVRLLNAFYVAVLVPFFTWSGYALYMSKFATKTTDDPGIVYVGNALTLYNGCLVCVMAWVLFAYARRK